MSCLCEHVQWVSLSCTFLDGVVSFWFYPAAQNFTQQPYISITSTTFPSPSMFYIHTTLGHTFKMYVLTNIFLLSTLKYLFFNNKLFFSNDRFIVLFLWSTKLIDQNLTLCRIYRMSIGPLDKPLLPHSI